MNVLAFRCGKKICKMKQTRHFSYISKEIHSTVVVRAAIASPGYNLKDQHAKAEDVDLRRHATTPCILWRHIATAIKDVRVRQFS